MFTSFPFDEKENKLDYYRGKDCIEKLCKKLKEHAMKIINYEEKERYRSLMKKISIIRSKKHVKYVKESFVRMKMMKIIKIKKWLKTTAITQENLQELPIAFAI